jgi:hypothetical protein
VTAGAPRDVRFLAATAFVAVALAWAFFARAALPTRVEALRLMVAGVLAALAFTPAGPRRRQGLLLALLSAWLLLNLWDARWLSILTTNFTTLGRWTSAHTPSNDYWVFYHAARDTYVLGRSPYAAGNSFPIPTYWFIHLLAGAGRLPIESAGSVLWGLNLLILAASLGGALLLLRAARPASSLAGVLLVLLLATTNPVLTAWAMGQTIILALGFWMLGALAWDRWRGLMREVGCAAGFVIAGMIKPPLLIFPAAFGVRAVGEAAQGGLRARGGPSPSARVGWWSVAIVAVFVAVAVALPGGVTWQTFEQFPQIGHAAQLTIGYELRFNFSLPFILLHKLEQHGLLSLGRWLEPSNAVLGSLAAVLFAVRLGPCPSVFRDLAPGLLIPPFILGAFESYYATWFLPFLLWVGARAVNGTMPPRGQALAWIGLGLVQVFTSPLFLVGVVLLLLASDYGRGGAGDP